MIVVYGIKAIVSKVRKVWRTVLRFPIKRAFAFRRKEAGLGESVTIFSSNCLGGIIYNTLGMRFDSPTINMYICPRDFIRFLMDYRGFLAANKFELVGMERYPIVRCYKKDSDEYVTLHCVHYNSLDEVIMKWKERSKRVTDHICVIMVQRDGCTEEDLKEFDLLPFDRKVCFTSKPYPLYNWAVCVKGKKQNPDSSEVIDLSQYTNWYTGKRYIDNFDYVSFVTKKSCLVQKELHI